MQNLNDYLDERRLDQIMDEILDLKMKHPLSEANKLRIQRLQQELSEIERNQGLANKRRK